MAPIVCVNTPDVNDRGEHQRGAIAARSASDSGRRREGRRPVTGEGPLFDAEGLLLVNGPNRLLGISMNPRRRARSCATAGT